MEAEINKGMLFCGHDVEELPCDLRGQIVMVSEINDPCVTLKIMEFRLGHVPIFKSSRVLSISLFTKANFTVLK